MDINAPSDFDALRLSPRDNVATVLRAVAAGERIRVKCGDEIGVVVAAETIPFCHKVCLVELAAGAPVVKYDSPIGAASTAIAAGAHVHVHNLRSARARADNVRPAATMPKAAPD